MTGSGPSASLEALDLDGGAVAGRRGELVDGARFTVRRWAPEAPDGMNVAIIDPDSVSHDDVVVVPASHGYRTDRLLLYRLQLLATVLGRRIAAVEAPGITLDYDDPRSTRTAVLEPSMIRSLNRGDFTPLASMQWRAIKDVLGYEPAAVRLVGESLGAQMSISMLPAIDARLLSVDLVEVVNARSLTAFELVRHGWHLDHDEESRRNRYIELNATRGWPAIKSFELASPDNAIADRELKKWRSQGRAAFAMAWGLRAGIVRTLGALSETTPGDLGLWHMRDSRVSSVNSNLQLLDELGKVGWNAKGFDVTAQQFPLPLGHHALTSFDLMVAFGGELARRWAS